MRHLETYPKPDPESAGRRVDHEPEESLAEGIFPYLKWYNRCFRNLKFSERPDTAAAACNSEGNPRDPGG